MKKKIFGTAYGVIDDEFMYLTKQVKIQRGDIRIVRPKRNGNGSIVVTRNSGAIRVCEDYEAIMNALHNADISADDELNTTVTNSISNLASTLEKNDETGAQILNVLRLKKGLFVGTASNLLEEIIASVNDNVLPQVLNANTVGCALRRNYSLFEKYFVMRKPRLRQGRTYYVFGGLLPGVEL